MRVLHVVTQVGTYGGERFVPALARAQRDAGLDVTVVTLSPGGVAPPGVPIRSIARRGRDPFQTIRFFSRLIATVRELRPDIVHTHLAYGKTWGRFATMLAGRAPIVHTEHANDFGGSTCYRYVGRLLHARTSRIVALSRAHAERITRYEGVTADRITIIPNGIEREPARDSSREEARLRLGLADGERVVLFLGRLDPVKRPELALEAFSLLPARLNARLWIAGDGPLRTTVEAAVQRLGIEERVCLFGYRSNAAELLAVSDALLNTSRTEAMPLSIIEARCEGVPVVCTPWPGAEELVEDGGVVAAGDGAMEIARALEAAFSGTRAPAHERNQLRERFSIERAANAHAALYRDVIGGTRHDYC